MWNMSGVKNFFLTEKLKLQFRAEFLDALEPHQPGGPNTTPTSAAFGSITANVGNNRSILFALKLMY